MVKNAPLDSPPELAIQNEQGPTLSFLRVNASILTASKEHAILIVAQPGHATVPFFEQAM